MKKLWLWKNFVDGRPEYWAFDNPYPINMDNGDPQTLGEPCGYAIVKESRRGRFDVSEAEVIAAIKRAKGASEAAQESRALALLKWMVTEWDDEQSKRTQSIADEPWRIKQARKIIGGYVPPMPTSSSQEPGKS